MAQGAAVDALQAAELLRSARRIVVKVGSSLVTNEGRGLDETAIGEWCRQLAHVAGGSADQAAELAVGPVGRRDRPG